MRDRVLNSAPFWLAIVGIALLTVQLGRYPAPWFDEGLNIGAAGTLAADGLYALPDRDGPRVMDAMIQTGPTVILPVALVLKLVGRELFFARLIVVGFALAALGLYWKVSRLAFDRETALAASLCLLAGNPEPFTSFIYMGRQVLGEAPALALVLAGLLVTLDNWSRPAGRASRVATVTAGLAWGAAMVTKSQVFVLLPVALCIVCLADLVYYRRRVWPMLGLSAAIGLACVAGWYAIQYLAAGEARFHANAEMARLGFNIHIFNLERAHFRNAASVIWRTGFLVWGLPGLIWALYLARVRDMGGLRRALLVALPLVSLAWFIALSIGWGRYAFYPFVLLPMWTANALVTWLRPRLRREWRPAAGLAAGITLALPLAAGAWHWSASIASPAPNGFESMRRYLGAHVPAGAVVETWEWELSLDERPQLRHPSTEMLYAAIEAQFLSRSAGARYSAAPGRLPEFVLDGPFSAWTGVFRPLVAERGSEVVSFPPYTLYRIRRDSP